MQIEQARLADVLADEPSDAWLEELSALYGKHEPLLVERAGAWLLEKVFPRDYNLSRMDISLEHSGAGELKHDLSKLTTEELFQRQNVMDLADHLPKADRRVEMVSDGVGIERFDLRLGEPPRAEVLQRAEQEPSAEPVALSLPQDRYVRDQPARRRFVDRRSHVPDDLPADLGDEASLGAIDARQCALPDRDGPAQHLLGARVIRLQQQQHTHRFGGARHGRVVGSVLGLLE